MQILAIFQTKGFAWYRKVPKGMQILVQEVPTANYDPIKPQGFEYEGVTAK